MPLTPGTKIAQYEVVEAIGAGGMGEVYRARDTKLERDVAIKVLPEEFAKDKERLARFEREAKLLASLNHPNIASIYGLESGALVLDAIYGLGRDAGWDTPTSRCPPRKRDCDVKTSGSPSDEIR